MAMKKSKGGSRKRYTKGGTRKTMKMSKGGTRKRTMMASKGKAVKTMTLAQVRSAANKKGYKLVKK